MMKKLFTIISAAAVCLLFAGCAPAANPVVSKGISSGSAVSSQPEIPSETISEIEPQSVPSHALPVSRQTASSKAQAAPSAVSQLQVKVTIPEGYSLSQIGAALESKGVCKKADFLAAINSYPGGYPIADQIPYNSSTRCYKLEGYLYPDTYYFFPNQAPKDVIAKMLRNAESKIDGKYSYPGMTTDQIITLASVIQKEAAGYSDMQGVSCVFHNRMEQGMALQADSTVLYLTIPYIPSGLVDTYKDYYNTVRRCKFPAGPICSPGADALKAAVNPTNAHYLYFASDKSGDYYFADTYSEQLQNCQKYGITSSPQLDSQPVS